MLPPNIIAGSERMTHSSVRCLILACGNTLRSDDGVGPWLAEWAENRFRSEVGLRILTLQQWAPELAEEIAYARSVLFIDCSAESAPGAVQIAEVQPATSRHGLGTHHLGAPELLALGFELYGGLPANAQLLTVGAGSTELGETFSDPVKAALPEACKLIEVTVKQLLERPKIHYPLNRRLRFWSDSPPRL
jgi:hydrogenase maturation protease